MNNTIDFNTAKTIDTMSKKIDHIDDTVSGFFSFMHMVINEFRKNGNETAIRILDSKNAIATVSALCTISAERRVDSQGKIALHTST